MPAAIFNVLVPFIGQQGPIDGVDYGRATFIFLSNTGGARINNLTLEYLTAGKERMQLSLYDFREVVADGAFQEEGRNMHRLIFNTYKYAQALHIVINV